MPGMSNWTKWEMILYAICIGLFYLIGMIMGFQFEWGVPEDTIGAAFMIICTSVIGYCYINLCIIHYKNDYDDYLSRKDKKRRGY